jgi:glycosyltransferase involved in cell wall biosynthesis
VDPPRRRREPRSIGLLPAYNADATIADAAFSLFPTTVPFELLIVDDGSREPVADILARDPRYASYGDRIHIMRKEPNGGLIAALNDGLAWILARDYDYVIRMDSDDIAIPDRAGAQVAFMEAHPQLLMAGSASRSFEKAPGDGNVVSRPTDVDAIRRRMRITSCFAHPTLIVRSEAYRKVGLYDPSYLHAEDFDWIWRCMRAGPVANQPDCLLHYRLSGTQISRQHWRAQLRVRIRVLSREFRHGEPGCIIGIAHAGLQLILPFRERIVRFLRSRRRVAASPSQISPRRNSSSISR